MDACTVTARDAITAFAVPDPSQPLAEHAFFSGPGMPQITPLHLHIGRAKQDVAAIHNRFE